MMNLSLAEENEKEITIDMFEKMLHDDDIRVANVPAGRYFAHRDGNVISMNRSYPRYIDPIRKVTGQYSIILYTPSLKAYDLGQLILSTFERPEQEDQQIYFKNTDLSDCRVLNLGWTDAQQATKLMSNASTAYIKQQSANRHAEMPDEVAEVNTSETHAFFDLPVATVNSCVPSTPKLRSVMMGFCDLLNKYLHTHHVDEEDHFHIRMTITTVEHMSSLVNIPGHALGYIVNTPPKAASGQIIFEQTQFRLKGLIDV